MKVTKGWNVQFRSCRGAVLCGGGKTTRDWWMKWCSSCNGIKVSKSSAEGRASNLPLNLCCHLHLRSLQCGWWPERKRSQVQAVEMGFLSRAARISLKGGVWGLDIRRRNHMWSQKWGIRPPRQAAELYRLEVTRCFFISCSTVEIAAIVVPLWQYLHGDGCVINSQTGIESRRWMVNDCSVRLFLSPVQRCWLKGWTAAGRKERSYRSSVQWQATPEVGE